MQLPLQPEDFTVGWICAIQIEREVAIAALDEEYTQEQSPIYDSSRDENAYNFGRIEDHSVVIAGLPQGRYGLISAAVVARDMQYSFPNIKIRLIVGIAGGAPSRKHDIRLGDVVVSCPTPTFGGVFQYDFGKAVQDHEFEATGFQASPSEDLLRGLAKLRSQHRMKGHKIVETMQRMLDKYPRMRRGCKRPSVEDHLFKSDYRHSNDGLCLCQVRHQRLSGDDSASGFLVTREERDLDEEDPVIHYGLIASSNSLMKDAIARDALIARYDVLCFEMEAAGPMNTFNSLIIRGICDYSDTHKNDDWHGYAAATAAAYAKESLQILPSRRGSSYQAYPRSSILGSLVEQQRPSTPKPVKSRYMIPFKENKRFIGRESRLNEMERRLLIDKESDRLAVCGLGGVGKTQLALKFCYNVVKARYPEYSIFWISMLSTARFRQDYAHIAKVCSLTIDDEADNKDDNILTIVKDYLNSEESGKWLLIADNADDRQTLFDDDDAIASSLPESDDGVILFTTRSRGLAVDLAPEAGEPLTLEEMELDEAERFLSKSLNRKDLLKDSEAARELLEALTYLPLAISQAASYITKMSITISEYLALMRDTRDGDEMVKLLSRDFQDNTRDTKSTNAVALTWLVSFEQIKREEPEAANLLFFLAFLENKAIPKSILPLSSEVDRTNAIGVLIGYSFLTRHHDVHGEDYDMHRLVHRAIALWMQNAEIFSQWKEKTIHQLAQRFPSNDWEDRTLWRQYIPHFTRVLQDTKQRLSNADRAQLCLWLGQCLEKEGRIREALTWIADCVSWQESNLPEDDRDRLIAQHRLGVLYGFHGRHQEALKCLENVVSVRAAKLPGDDSSLMSARQELANAYLRMKQIRKAFYVLKEMVEATEKAQKEGGFDQFIPSNQGSTGEQSKYKQVSKGSDKKGNGTMEEHPLPMLLQSILPVRDLDMKHVKEAIQLLEKVLAVRGKFYREGHPDLLVIQHNLAGVYLRDQRVKESIIIEEKVVTNREKVWAGDHPLLQAAQHTLGIGYVSDGQAKKSIQIMEKLVSVRTRLLGANHPNLIQNLHTLACAYFVDGQSELAIDTFEKLLALEKDNLVEDHPDRLSTQHELARAYAVNGRLDEAISLMEYVVAIRSRSLSVADQYRTGSERQLTLMLNSRDSGDLSMIERVNEAKQFD